MKTLKIECKLEIYVIKHDLKAFFYENTWNVYKNKVILRRDFFIVLDLRLTKIGRMP